MAEKHVHFEDDEVEHADGAVGGAGHAVLTSGMGPVKGAVGGVSAAEDIITDAEATLARLERNMCDLAMQMTNLWSGLEVREDESDSANSSSNEPRVDSVGGQSPRRGFPSPSRMSGAELEQHRVDVLLHILDELNLEKYQQRFREALQRNTTDSVGQLVRQGEVNTGAVTSTIAGIDPLKINALTEKIVDKIKKMELDDDAYQLVESALMALIQNDESAKSIFDLVNTYNVESASIPSSFYSGRQDLEKFTKRSWTDYVINEAVLTSSKHLEGGNATKLTLARVCKALSKRLGKPRNDLKKFVSYAGDLLDVGKKLASSEKRINAVFAFFAASKLYRLVDGGEISLIGITMCAREIHHAVEEMQDKQAMIVNHVISIKEKMLKYIRYILVDESYKIGFYTKCRIFVGVCYYIVGEYKLSLSEFEYVIDVMEKEFGETVGEYKAYGNCLRYAALCCELESFGAAANKFYSALEAYEGAKAAKAKERKKALWRV